MSFSVQECQQILGVPGDATAEAIRQAYLDLVRVWHPDRFQSDERLRLVAEDKLRQVNQAYAVLKDCPTAERGQAPPPPNPPRPEPDWTQAWTTTESAPPPRPSARGFHEDDPLFTPPAAAPPYQQPRRRRAPQRSALLSLALCACFAVPMWAFVRSASLLLRVPTLDDGLLTSPHFQPRILTPMRGIDPALGLSGVASTLSAWAHGDLVDLWKPAEPVAPAATTAPRAAATSHARTAPRSGQPLEPLPAPSNGADLISPARMAGAGELRLSNQTDREAVVKLVRGNGAVVRAVYLTPEGRVNLRSIPIGVYSLHVELGHGLDAGHLRFRDDRSTPSPIGPFQFLEVTSDTGVSGSHFEVALKPRV